MSAKFGFGDDRTGNIHIPQSMKIVELIKTLCADGSGATSSMRFVMLYGAALLLTSITGIWIAAMFSPDRLPIANAASLSLGAILGGILTAKLFQNNQENKAP